MAGQSEQTREDSMFRKALRIGIAAGVFLSGMTGYVIAADTETGSAAATQAQIQKRDQTGEQDRVQEQKRDQTSEQDRDRLQSQDRTMQKDQTMTHDRMGSGGMGAGKGMGGRR
jgi:mannitol-specific phosphotransferase system IIBC component